MYSLPGGPGANMLHLLRFGLDDFLLNSRCKMLILGVFCCQRMEVIFLQASK